MWKLEPVGSEWVRLQNSWYRKNYIHNEKGKLDLGPIQPGWNSAMWGLQLVTASVATNPLAQRHQRVESGESRRGPGRSMLETSPRFQSKGISTSTLLRFKRSSVNSTSATSSPSRGPISRANGN